MKCVSKLYMLVELLFEYYSLFRVIYFDLICLLLMALKGNLCAMYENVSNKFVQSHLSQVVLFIIQFFM